MTEKLFYKDSHLKTFKANVISCEPFEKAYRAVLNRTAFFPEGGGQLADTGKLGDVEVIDVREKDGVIWHIVTGRLESGEEVNGTIHWEKRFSRMQQHTGEHIVSGLIHEKFGYQNVGFHLGEEVCTFDLDGPITKEQLKRIEKLANQVVFANVPVEVCYPSDEELEKMEYRSKIEIEGQVRIVTIPGCDVCACCAPHVKSTGEIGLIKFTHMQNYKGGVRITMVCGERALRDYQAKEESVKAIMYSLSAKEECIAEAVEHLKDENALLKAKFQSVQRQILRDKAQTIPQGQKCVCLFEENLEGNAPRELMNQVLERNVEICGVFTENHEDGYRYVIGSRIKDVRQVCKTLNMALNGRGGGKIEMVQGSVKGMKQEVMEIFYQAAEQ